MGNCLVTKLAGSINDPSILKLNEIRFRIGKRQLGIKCTATGKAYAINNTTFPDGTTEKNLSTGWNYIQYEDEHPFDVSVDKTIIESMDCGDDYTNKSDILLSNPGIWNSIISISGLNFNNIPFESDSLQYIGERAQGRAYNFNPQSVLPEILTINISNGEHDVTEFAGFVKMTLFGYSASSIYGEIVSFLNAIAENRTSGTLRLITNNITTYNGVVTSLNASLYFNFGTSMVNPTAEDTERGWQETTE